MNVYDFDDTVYSGDSTVDFYKFCVGKKPWIILHFPFVTSILFALGIKKKLEFKEKFYGFLKSFDNIDEVIGEFWNTHSSKIKQWYYESKEPDDVIISASPEFLLKPVCEKLGVCLMASKVDKHTGKYDGENCWGEEKVLRYRERFGFNTIDKFYSDSLSDSPLAEISEEAYVVTGNRLEKWENYRLPQKKMVIKTIFSPEFLRFIVIGIINSVNCVIFSSFFSMLMGVNAAFVLGYLLSLLIGYIYNSKLNFHEKLSFWRLAKFAVSYIPNCIIQNVIVYTLSSIWDVPQVATYCLAAVISFPITFALVKFYAFAKENKRN